MIDMLAAKKEVHSLSRFSEREGGPQFVMISQRIVCVFREVQYLQVHVL